MDLIDVLTELCAVSAPSGAEMELASLLEHRWAPRCQAIRRDPTGNVIAHVGGSGPRVLVQAHMDQVGYVVRFVTESGQLLLDTAQGDRRTGPERRHPVGQPVRVLTRETTWIDGLIVAASGHVLTSAQREAELGFDDFWVESGFGSRAAALDAGVHIGSPAVFSAPTRAFGDLLVGPAMDNRVGLAIMDALIDFAGELTCELWLGATVQEENGLHGARALALAERFEAAIAVDVGLVGDIPAVDEKEYATSLGDGPIIVHRDTGIIYDRTLTQHLLALGREHGIPAQDGLFASYGSDGLAIAETGSPTALLTVGTRYTHTAFETIHTEDLRASVALLRAFVTSALPARA